MKYFVFAGEHYPAGGALDFHGVYTDPYMAFLSIPRNRDWAHVVEFDGQQMTIVAERDGDQVRFYPERMAHMRAQAPRRPDEET